jgi:hypothetical protein
LILVLGLVPLPIPSARGAEPEPQPSDFLLAAALLDGDPTDTDEMPPEDLWPTVTVALRRLAVEREYLTPDQTKYYFVTRSIFESDLRIVRNNRSDVEGAPPLADARRLPSARQAREFMMLNREFAAVLKERAKWELDRLDLLHRAIDECERRYRVWDFVADAQSEVFSPATRRKALKRLREEIGEADYAVGKMPLYAPEWCFSNQ